MKREDLKKIEGLSDEAIDAIMKLHGLDVEANKTATQNAVKTVQDQLDAIKTQLDEANTKIQGFEKLKPEELQAAVTEWKDKATKFEQDLTQAKKDADARVEALKFDSDLSEELKSTYKVFDPADVLHRLNREKITRGEDGKSFVGLKEQVEPLQESHKYLFNSEDDGEPTPKIVVGGKPAKVIDDKVVAAARQYAGVEDPKSE